MQPELQKENLTQAGRKQVGLVVMTMQQDHITKEECKPCGRNKRYQKHKSSQT